jgi:hypothetical protein
VIVLLLSDIPPDGFDAEALVPSEEEVDIQLVGLRTGSERAGQQEGLQAQIRYVRVLAQDVTHGSLPVHASIRPQMDEIEKLCELIVGFVGRCLLKKDFCMRQHSLASKN